MSASACAADPATRRFASAMAAAGGWEDRPLLAVALSGGPDSLALALFAQHWAAERGGAALALIVDHRVRPAAHTEARLAAAWAGAAGLAARIIVLPDGLRARADTLRTARHAALAAAAAEAGALHLLLGHHRADQAETVLLRAMAGPGEAGLAAMAPCRVLGAMRLLRPLLGATPEELKAVLRARAQGWIADPSNDAAGARAVLRRAMGDAAGEGVAVAALAEAAATRRAARGAGERAVAALLGRAASLPAPGGVLLDHAVLAAAPLSIRMAALAAVLARVSGRERPPRGEAMGRAAAGLAAARRFTLGGCVLSPRGRSWHVVAERRRVAAVAEAPALRYGARARDGAPAGMSVQPEAVEHAPQAEGLDAAFAAPSVS